MPTSSFSMRLEDDLKASIEEEARRNDVSAAQYINRTMRMHISAQIARRDAIKAAFAEADKGEFISSEAMLKWVNSWGSEHELPMPEPDIKL